MKKLVYFLVIATAVLSACAEAESEKEYTVEDARDNGDVIVEHETQNFDQIAQGALEIENIGEMTTLLEKVENEEEYSVDVSIFDTGGSHYKNTFETDGTEITFENNYEGYSQAGTFTCQYMSKRGPMIYLSQCESEEGEEHSTLLGFIGKEEAFREAE
ncbi:hypothetical protein [Salimicrobium halophilum]|uniref:DUF4362 domain-containing protein n=1 Tax=Salimicrobium halophilum TaxID=86666 RepID=A0A1G8RG23_9BACI|nr:hypothetical protein [Salimicrobium halophilum]SDJ15803.1 hypothetical protein SAMN04490247_1005 [Salimicrobium halophilum]